MYKIAALTLIGILVCAGSVLAAGGPSISTRTLNVKGTSSILVAPDPNVNAMTGACNFSAWIDVCSGTNCSCEEIAVSSQSGSMEKGNQTVTNFFITSDHDIDPSNGDLPLVYGLEGNCRLLRGVLTDTAATEKKTLNFLGTSCRVFIGISSKNPHGKKVGRSSNGSWAIDGASPPSPPASGWGSFSVNSTDKKGSISVDLTGLVTQ